MNCPYIDCVYGRTEIFLGVGIAIAFGIESYDLPGYPDSDYGNEHDNDNRYADNDNENMSSGNSSTKGWKPRV